MEVTARHSFDAAAIYQDSSETTKDVIDVDNDQHLEWQQQNKRNIQMRGEIYMLAQHRHYYHSWLPIANDDA